MPCRAGYTGLIFVEKSQETPKLFLYICFGHTLYVLKSNFGATELEAL